MNIRFRRRRSPEFQQSCDREAMSPLAGKSDRKPASRGSVLRTVIARRWMAPATGITLFLWLMCAGCSGFFISPTLSSIYLTPASATVAVNNTVQMIATGTYSDGTQNTLSGSTVGWSSSDDTIASVTSPGGLVTGVATGTATITATAQGVSATGTVTVSPSNITTLAITTTQGSTASQTTATLSGVPATLQFYAYGNMSSNLDLTNAVTWSSSNTNVAMISSGLSSGSGLVTSVAPGTTNITASIINTTTGMRITSNTIVLTVQ